MPPCKHKSKCIMSSSQPEYTAHGSIMGSEAVSKRTATARNHRAGRQSANKPTYAAESEEDRNRALDHTENPLRCHLRFRLLRTVSGIAVRVPLIKASQITASTERISSARKCDFFMRALRYRHYGCVKEGKKGCLSRRRNAGCSVCGGTEPQ